MVLQSEYTDLARPLKNFPIAMKSSWSEQLNTTHWIAIAFAKSYADDHANQTQNICFIYKVSQIKLHQYKNHDICVEWEYFYTKLFSFN